jgi:protein PhnA
MSKLPNCPQCDSEYTYQDQTLLICPECAHEWSANGESDDKLVIRDSVGNFLQDGDDVTIIKDLKVRGSSQVIKVGTKAKGIRLINPDDNDDHDIDCKIQGFGPMRLKSNKVKKA